MDNTNITIESGLFTELRSAFNGVLERTLASMREKNTDEAEMTIKVNIALEDLPEFYDFEDDTTKQVLLPQFKHKVSSIMKIKDETSGRNEGGFIIEFDKESGEFHLSHLEDPQFDIDELMRN